MHQNPHAGVIEPHSKCNAESHKKASNVGLDPFGLEDWGLKLPFWVGGWVAKTVLLALIA